MVKENVHNRKLSGTNLSVPGSNIATVTNSDGFFSLKMPGALADRGIKADHVGYKSALIAASAYKGRQKPLEIRMEPMSKMLDEVTVVGADPRELIGQALKKIPLNYPDRRNMFSSFYRETIQKGKRYISVSEAIVNVFKNSYKSRYIGDDKVQVMKGRRLVSQRRSDTLAVKIAGGPRLPVVLDVVKNENLLLNPDELDFYDFSMDQSTEIDGRRQFVVRFKPRVKVDYALSKGKIFVDQQTLSITRAEFSLDMSDKEKATRAILFKKPRGLHFKPQALDVTVTYKFQDGKSYLNYICTVTRFKCDWKRRLFSSGYTVSAEMVMVDRDDDPQTGVARKDAFGNREVFYDVVDDFIDADFWKDYNIIEPTQSLEKAVIKLNTNRNKR